MIFDGPKPKEISGPEPNTTNNRMEFRAAIEALRHLKIPSRVRLYYDSACLINNFQEGWVSKWERKGWRKADNKPVKNDDLWRELLELSRYHKVEFVKVAEHADIAANERCHALVQLEMSREGPGSR